MASLILLDLKSFAHGSKIRDFMKVILLSPGFKCVCLFRLQSYFYEHHLLLLAYAIYRANLSASGADIVPGCKIGGGLRIEHPVGIVIGAGTVIGTNCTILQGVTFGVKYVDATNNDHQYPTIGNDVIIGTKASILGGITIGAGSVVGAHSVVLKSFENASHIAGIPGIKIGENK